MARKITPTALESRPCCVWEPGSLEFRQYGARIRVERVREGSTLREYVGEFTTLETQETGNWLTPGRLRAAAARWINDNIQTN
ncbi:hypothetical protein SEA_ALTADENA_71 [Arthrobacter phage Altadena]|uniref:Uncharacterized protein n=1 Tax=Arthrobacter phage Altadena TaxID=3059064 RepID=A0AA96KK13_9CAUD|nr:hypothetical protein SEA_ALTADENA_71 [Arthrobacter phage Altadena]